jgi:hypothetical protein
MSTLAWGLGWLFGLPLFILGLDAVVSELHAARARRRRVEEFARRVDGMELKAGRERLLAAVRASEPTAALIPAQRTGGER